MKSHRYGEARALIDRSRVVCVAKICGGLDLAGAQSLMGDIGGPAGAGQLVHVVDYSAALIKINPDELLRVAEFVSKRDGADSTPAALVVSDGQRGLFDAYARIAQAQGVAVKVLSSFDEAQRWAATQADVIGYWGQCHRALT